MNFLVEIVMYLKSCQLCYIMEDFFFWNACDFIMLMVNCMLLVVGIGNCIYGASYWLVNATFVFWGVKWSQLLLFEVCIVVSYAWSEYVGLLHSFVWSSWASNICDFVWSQLVICHIICCQSLTHYVGVKVVSLSNAKMLAMLNLWRNNVECVF
jgi:hypothetical protein